MQGVLEKLQYELKAWKAQMRDMAGQEDFAAEPAALLEQNAAGLRCRMEQEKEAGILPREDELALRGAADKLDGYVMELKKSGFKAYDEAFAQVRESYNALCRDYRQKKSEAGAALEYAFDFLEAAFLQGQEMVIFITELNMNRYCVRFLQEYECEKYYRYNKELLFEDRQRELMQRIDELEEV